MSAYVSGAERLAAEMQRAMSGRHALERVQAEGVCCHKCGAKNAVADMTAVQVPCGHCGTTILLSDHVSADAVARARMRQGLMEMRDGLVAADKKRDRLVLIGVCGALGVAALVVLVLGVLGVLR